MNANNAINIIIGKESNLSSALEKKESFISLSAREIILNKEILKPYKKNKIKLIFNNFQPSVNLGNIKDYSEYIKRAILSTSIVLDYFNPKQIVKIIYTSSSSVYGNNALCSEYDDVKIMNLHPALKLSNEKMIENYSSTFSIDYTIARVFNMYGGDDKFSIISKILDAYINNKTLTVVNNGSAIRDFIHIDNIVDIYVKLLYLKDIPIINIGRGKGTSVEKILYFLHSEGVTINTKNIVRDEIKVSTSNGTLLKSLIKVENFIEVETYLKEKLKL